MGVPFTVAHVGGAATGAVLEISGGSIGFTPIYVSVGNRTFVSVALLVSS
jgi:hypothetical protein